MTITIKTLKFFIFCAKKIYHYLFLIYPIDNLLINARKKSHKVEVLFNDFELPKNRYLCVFIHFDPKNSLDKNAEHYLNSLKIAGCDIVLVSTSDCLTPLALETAKKYCRTIIRRSNVGRDIYSYKIGVDFVSQKISSYEKLIIANDSVFGPFFDISKLIDFGDDKSLDFWGATDCHQIKYHLQSYFFVFTQKMANSECFKQYWNDIKLINYKRHLIEKYEVGITQYFMKKGYRCDAYCAYNVIVNNMPTETLAQKMRKQFFQKGKENLVQHAWDLLIMEYHFPFLKKELVRKNPTKNKRIDFQDVVNKYANHKLSLS